MKKFTLSVLALALALLLSLTAFSEEDWFFASDGFAQDPHGISGEYMDSVSQRASLYIYYDEEADPENSYTITIQWGNSAFETVEWYMTGRYEAVEEGRIVSVDCEKSIVTYSGENAMDFSLTTVYTDGECTLTLIDGILYWEDGTENAGESCRFEKTDESDFFSEAGDLEDWRLFYNPNGYDVIYVTEIFDVDGTHFVFGCFGTIDEKGDHLYFNELDSMIFPLAADAAVMLPESLPFGAPTLCANPTEWYKNACKTGMSSFYADFTMLSDGSLSALTYLFTD